MSISGLGRPWDLDRTFTGGVRLLQPYQGRHDTDWYAGTADAVTQNINFIRRGSPRNILILSGDHIYEMDYDMLVRYHEENEADATVCVIRVPLSEASRYGIMAVDENNRIIEFVEKPPRAPWRPGQHGRLRLPAGRAGRVAARGCARPDSKHDFGYNIIPRMIELGMRVMAFPFGGYWIAWAPLMLIGKRTWTCSARRPRSISTTARGSFTPAARSARRCALTGEPSSKTA